MPSSRTRRVTEWQLGNGGMLLRFSARPPFRLVLDVPAPATLRPLTAPLADDLAGALLAGARELDHANAVAEQAVHADRAGESITESVRTWLATVRSELRAATRGWTP